MRVNCFDKAEDFLAFVLDFTRVSHTYLLEIKFLHHGLSLCVSCIAESILEAFCLRKRACQLHHDAQ